MKRFICIVLCFVMVFCLFACTQQQEKFVKPISFYYLRVQLPDQIHHGAADSVISPEIREGQLISKDIKMLLDYYLAGPITADYDSPFPQGTTLVEWHTEGATLCVTLSDEAAELTGIELTLACACLTKTFLELREFEAVRIQAESLPLDGKASITMDDTSLLLLDTTMIDTEPDDK